jgi:hypothetical protein
LHLVVVHDATASVAGEIVSMLGRTDRGDGEVGMVGLMKRSLRFLKTDRPDARCGDLHLRK